MSPLTLLPLRTVILIPLLSLYPVFPLPLRKLLLLLFLPLSIQRSNTRRRTFSKSLEPSKKLGLLLLFLSHLFFPTVLARDPWRLSSRSCIAVRPTWSVITSSSSMKTILLLSGLKDWTACLLQPPSFGNKPCFIGSNTRPKTLMRLMSHPSEKSLKLFFVGAQENHKLLLIVSKGPLEETPNTCKKK